MQILNNKEINHKIKRLAFEIHEQSTSNGEITFLGINNNGKAFAKLLANTYVEVSGNKVSLGTIKLDPSKPVASDIVLDIESPNLNNKHVVVVDDVANTGRTIYYALEPIMKYLPAKVQVAVLVDRKHKSFPIAVDYVGLSLATTLMENIRVDIKKATQKAAFLE